MGGRGSGRRAVHKYTCESYKHTIDVGWLKRDGVLIPGALGHISWSRAGDRTGSITFHTISTGIRLSYLLGGSSGSPECVEDFIPLTWTSTNFGGQRPWFLCPGCQHRRRILYGDDLFRCRSCLDLKYDSQYEAAWSRVATQAHKFREKHFGDSAPLHESMPEKPTGMHWKTFERLQRKDLQMRRAWLEVLRAQLPPAPQ